MTEPSPVTPPPLPVAQRLLRFAVIGLILLLFVLALLYVGGWLTPQRLTAPKIVNQLQTDGGLHPGFRRNHAKGVCVAGYFDSNGNAAPYSVAQVFAQGRTPVLGRLAIPGGNPYAPDSSAPIRSMALRFTQADGQQWRTGMNAMPVFLVGTVQAFFDQLKATQPDPNTGKPDPAKVKAFFASHPESGPFLAWLKTAEPSASFTTESYWSLDAFELVDAQGNKHAGRWRMVPDNGPASAGGPGTDYLAADLSQRLSQGPQKWHLLITLANPGDPTNDASKAWPADRKEIDAGTLVLTGEQAQDSGPCRDVNYDPLVLPHGIEGSDDPLLAARSAAYAVSYMRRTSEEAHIPGAAKPQAEAH